MIIQTALNAQGRSARQAPERVPTAPRHQRFLTLLLVVVVVAASCTSTDAGVESEEVSRTTQGPIQLLGDVRLDSQTVLNVPDGALPAGATAEAHPASLDQELPTGVELGALVDVELSEQPSQPLTVSFQAPARMLDPADGAVVGVHVRGEMVEYIEAQTDPKEGTVKVSTSDFSPLGFLYFDADAIKSQFSKAVNEALAGAFTKPEPPKCDGEDLAKEDGWSISSTSSDSVLWCFGMDGGDRILTAVNNKRYPILVSVPTSATLVTRSDRGIAGVVTELISNDSILTLEGAASATWRVDLNQGDEVSWQSEFDGLAHVVMSVDVAVNWLVLIAAKMKLGSPSKLKDSLVGLIENSGCLAELVTKTDAYGEFDLSSIVALVRGCLDPDILKDWAGGSVAVLVLASLVFGTAEYLRDTLPAIPAVATGSTEYKITIARDAAEEPAEEPVGSNCPDGVEQALCRFLDALVTSDKGLLTDDFEITAFESYSGAPPRSWSFDSCDLEGDLHQKCLVRLDNADGGVASLYSLTVGPSNVIETPDGYFEDPANPGLVVKSIEYGP